MQKNLPSITSTYLYLNYFVSKLYNGNDLMYGLLLSKHPEQ